MTYVDGFILPLKKDKVADYKKIARKAMKVWMDHGALDYAECLADDAPVGKTTSFPRSVKLKDDEIVVFSYIVYKSRKDRDRIMKAVMEDKRLQDMMDPSKMPFDGKRMIFGGFKTIVSV